MSHTYSFVALSRFLCNELLGTGYRTGLAFELVRQASAFRPLDAQLESQDNGVADYQARTKKVPATSDLPDSPHIVRDGVSKEQQRAKSIEHVRRTHRPWIRDEGQSWSLRV